MSNQSVAGTRVGFVNGSAIWFPAISRPPTYLPLNASCEAREDGASFIGFSLNFLSCISCTGLHRLFNWDTFVFSVEISSVPPPFMISGYHAYRQVIAEPDTRENRNGIRGEEEN